MTMHSVLSMSHVPVALLLLLGLSKVMSMSSESSMESTALLSSSSPVRFHFSSIVDHPPEGSEDELSFITIGDWGCGKNSLSQQSVARQMGIVAEKYNVSFFISVGDNFYPIGVDSVDDPQWQDTFEDIYHEPSLQRRWYVIGGNHDEYSNLSAQIAYSKTSSRWFFPNYYYSETLFAQLESDDDERRFLQQRMHLFEEEAAARNKQRDRKELIMFESDDADQSDANRPSILSHTLQQKRITPVPTSPRFRRRKSAGAARLRERAQSRLAQALLKVATGGDESMLPHHHDSDSTSFPSPVSAIPTSTPSPSPSSPSSVLPPIYRRFGKSLRPLVDMVFLDAQMLIAPGGDPAQYQWFVDALDASEADYLIVVSHHPIYSGGEHGSHPVLQRYIQPLVEMHNTSLFLSGHDHVMQHLFDNNVHHIGVGTGCKSSGQARALKQTQFASKSLGFVLHRIRRSEEKMLVTFFDEAGRELHSFSVPVRH